MGKWGQANHEPGVPVSLCQDGINSPRRSEDIAPRSAKAHCDQDDRTKNLLITGSFVGRDQTQLDVKLAGGWPEPQVGYTCSSEHSDGHSVAG